MPLFTFIAEYDGGTFISQKTGDNISGAIELWKKTESENLSCASLDDFDDMPTIINESVNVWCCHSIINEKQILLNIIKTNESI